MHWTLPSTSPDFIDEFDVDGSGRGVVADVVDLAGDAEHRVTETVVSLHLPFREHLLFAKGEPLPGVASRAAFLLFSVNFAP